jgi:hypothetical protein
LALRTFLPLRTGDELHLWPRLTTGTKHREKTNACDTNGSQDHLHPPIIKQITLFRLT